MTDLEQCAQMPPNWTIFGLRFERYPRAASGPGSRGRWGCSDGAYGVGNCRTPLHAWLAQRRWKRESLANPGRYCE